MALVNGPLFSLDASGQIGKALVYSKWKGRNYVREYVVGANPNTIGQLTRRAMFGLLSRWWGDMDTTEQDSWIPGASAKEISPFNEQVGINMDRQTNELVPAANVVPAGGAITGTADTIVPTGGIGKIDVVLTNTANLIAGEYNMVCISDVSFADSNSVTNSAWFGLDGASDQTLAINDLEVGTYWLSFAVINQGGTITAFTDAASSVNVT